MLTALCWPLISCSPAEAPPPAAPVVAAPPAASSAAVEAPMPPAITTEERFATFAAGFLEAYLEREPVRATELGDHRFDGKWPDVSAEGDRASRAWVEGQLKALEAMPEAELSPQSRVDREIARTQLRYWLFSLDELKPYERDPLLYTGLIGDGIDPLVTRDFAPVEARMKDLLSRLSGVPKIVEVARARLSGPTEIHVDTAIKQNKGLIALCEGELPAHFDKVPALKADLLKASQAAAASLKEFQKFLEGDLKARARGDFRLGRARFEKKLRFVLDDEVAIDDLARDARALLEKTQGEMVETARELWPSLFKGKPWREPKTAAERKKIVRAVLDAVAADHPTNTSIVKEAEAQLAEATAFVKKHDLVRLPDEPCRVIEMPEYRRGVAVAYCDSSGPLEQKQETFYAISPTPRDWDKKRVDSFYREYNRAMLNDLTVHEAMPGHFLQLMHNNRFRSKLRAVFQSGAFVEGWAVYAEWLMARHGYGGPRVKLQRQKMVLRLCANAILDHDIHAGSMDEKQALALMEGEAFQENGEAVGKWRRARLTSAQLTTYFYGFSALLGLRLESEKTPGFSERAFHDRLLASGSPPPRHARTLVSATP